LPGKRGGAKVTKNKNVTPYPDVNDILAMVSENLKEIFGDQLVGVYLTGSLTYGDFDRGSSDIDLLVVVHEPLSQEQGQRVKNMHARIAEEYPKWAKRIECSYITNDMLHSIEPPKTPRPYVNGGQMWESASYGHEWLVNLYALYVCGIALVGPDPKELIDYPIDIKAVRRASKNDLHQEWEPLLKYSSSLQKDSHLQTYVIMTLCRILHRAKKDNVVSKRVAASWVKKTYGSSWIDLIEKAERWQHGQEMDTVDELLKFIEFILQEVE
jgi:hypothetical protein